MSKENIFKLTGQSGRFVCENMDAFKRSITILFPCFLVLALANHVGNVYGYTWITYVTALPFIYVFSAFSLIWHGVSLRGPEESIKNPFVWQKGDGKFHAMFIGILVAVLGFSTASEQVSLYVQASSNQGVILFGSLASLVVMCAVLYYTVRLMFFLPAQSVGVTLSYEDIKKASKGSMFRFVVAMILTSVTFVIVMSIYLLVVSVILQATGSTGETAGLSSAIIAFILSIPLYAAVFFYWAVNITVLSRLYQWGIQNNA